MRANQTITYLNSLFVKIASQQDEARQRSEEFHKAKENIDKREASCSRGNARARRPGSAGLNPVNS